MTHGFLRFFYSSLFCLVFQFLNSQNNGFLIEKSLEIKIPFTITQFSTKNGLPQSRIVDIITKGNGNLIIATANGIVEYNGTEFSTFIKDEAYKTEYYTKLVWHDASGILLGLTSSGHLKSLYPLYKELGFYRSAFLNEDSLFCINSAGEIWKTHIKTLQFKKAFDTQVAKPHCIIKENNSFLIGSSEGLFRLDTYSKKIKRIHQTETKTFRRNPFDNSVYFLTDKTVCKLINDSIKTQLDIYLPTNSTFLQDIDFISADAFYASSSKGLYEVTPEYTDRYTKVSALPSSFLQSLHYNSKENCLFVGTGENGLLKLQFKNCYSFTSDQGFTESSSLSSIIRNKDGKLIVCDNNGIVYKLGIDTAIKLLNIGVMCASLAEVDDDIYVGTWKNGIYIINGTAVVDSINSPRQLPSPAVHAVYKDTRGFLWVGTSRAIAMGRSRSDIKPFLPKQISGKVNCFYELKDGTICAGGKEGVFLINTKNKLLLHLGKKEGITGREVRAFYEDAEGKLWIGTYDGGLYCYFKKVLTPINLLKNSKLDIDAFCLAKDEFGYIYISSNHGLWRIAETKLSDFYYGRIKYLIPFYYGEETGIVNTEFNGGFQNNYLKTRMNHIYFPSIEGLVIVDPEETSFRKLSPQIDKVYVNDTLHDFKLPVLNDKTFSVAFNFSCLSYLNKYNVHFQYKLEGNKKSEWSSLQKEATVAFKMLPSGKYTFTLRALDAFNDDKPNEVSYSFEIKPVFYDTLWFKTLLLVMILLLASIIIRLRITKFRKEAGEKERVRRQLAEFELKATHAQMNPHFIFNSLNSIKYYLSINDQKNADNYIDHFSSLLRSFLENGSKDFIELKDEICILTSYLELEKQRMNPPFTYTIWMDTDLQETLIPTHIIQPFVENAIKHGINHSEKKCHLSVSFYVLDGLLICEIEDDGIGRERSKRINKERLDHTSKGLEMVMEKIRIVKEIYKLEIILNIEDNYEQGIAKGTKVEIRIPLKQNENSNS